MTPEQSMQAAMAETGLPGGHWPYTCAADVFVGWRPAGDRFTPAGKGPVRVAVRYDIVLCARRGAQGTAQAEAARFALYGALRKHGFRLVDNGPEEYEPKTEMFYWPVTAEKGFGVDAIAQPYDVKEV